MAVKGNGPIGIGFREIKRLTDFANNTIVRWISHFQVCNITYKDSRSKIYVRENIGSEFEKDLITPKQSERSKRRILHSKRSIHKRMPTDNLKQRKNNVYSLISTVAAIGNSSWNRTTDHGYGFVSMTDMKAGSDINFVSTPLMGIGISDFRKKDKAGIQSMLDTRTFLDYNERFSYLNLSDQEAQLYINELCDHDPPILKEIRVFDYKFLCFVDDPDQPDSIRLEREDLNIYAQNTFRLTFNIDDDDDDKLPCIHEINYDTHQDKITSRILIDLNSEKAKKLLGLDTFYDGSNNFSISIWGEKRYIIADPVLREFIGICNVMFEAVYRKMEQLYSSNLLSKDVRREYRKWHRNVYGPFRRGAEILLVLDRITVNRIKQIIKQIKRFAKQGKNEEKKKIIEELDYACRYRMWGPYERTGVPSITDFTHKDFENIEKRLKQLDGNSHDMIRQFGKRVEKYYNEFMSQKYENIRKRYGIITEPLLNTSYPAFLKKLFK
jgi:hypothetical protein